LSDLPPTLTEIGVTRNLSAEAQRVDQNELPITTAERHKSKGQNDTKLPTAERLAKEHGVSAATLEKKQRGQS